MFIDAAEFHCWVSAKLKPAKAMEDSGLQEFDVFLRKRILSRGGEELCHGCGNHVVIADRTSFAGQTPRA